MSFYQIKTGGKEIFSWCSPLEDGALLQAKAAAELPFTAAVALMPDAHQGYGVPIGCVLVTEGVVIPNAVGVDIGCGMRWGHFKNIKVADIPREKLLHAKKLIEERIPMGGGKRRATGWTHAWARFGAPCKGLELGDVMMKDITESMGTLGGGNHFIELQVNELGNLCFMIHSGSRHIGQVVAKYFHEIAKTRGHKHGDLSGLGFDSDDCQNYLNHMDVALEFAEENRFSMAMEVKLALNEAGIIDLPSDMGTTTFEDIDIHHNYAAVHYGVVIHRKGATLAHPTKRGIIPGSMGTSSYIVRGVEDGNLDLSWNSCSHGAGRQLGRGAAKKQLNLEEERAKMDEQGIVHSLTAETLDEAAGAYKDIDVVMEAQSDLVEIVHTLKPIVAMKGSDDIKRK